MIKTVLGVFDSRADAESAIDDLHEAGFRPKNISIIMKSATEGQRIAQDRGTVVADSALSGAATGGVVGGLAGLLIGIGAIAVPGIGGLLIAGPLAASLGLTGAAATTVSGVATGVLAGGIIGALVGLGLPEEDARVYENRIRAGAIVVAVSADESDAQDAQVILEDNNAEQIRMLATSTTTQAYEDDISARPVVLGTKGGKTKKVRE